MEDITNIIFFTCCNGVYKNFIPLFILSNLYHNDNSFVEIGVDYDVDINLSESISILNNLYPNKFLIRNVNFESIVINKVEYNIMPNTIRFITTPKIKSKYVYISDVDIITLDQNICNQHIKHMEKENIPYSNIVRPYSEKQKYKKLTGLHFTPYNNYYPIPKYTDLIESGLYNDEDFLYQLVKKRYNNISEISQWRPVHGIHVSPNRKPTDGVDWGMKKWKNQWVNFRNSKEFLLLEPTLTNYISEKILIIDSFYGDNCL